MINREQLEVRAQRARSSALVAIHAAGSGHPGGVLSALDMINYLAMHALDWHAYDAQDQTRSRFVLSKGHACPALYAVAAEEGLVSYQDLTTLRKLGSPLQGHTCVNTTPWAEANTGSLAQGFSVAVGMALGYRYQSIARPVYCMLGDGELQEGQVWEGAMCAAHYDLRNLCVFVDYNKMQSDEKVARIMGLEPLADKWRAWNWRVVEIDGHDYQQIHQAVNQSGEGPLVIIAHTLKGRGVSYMEGSPLWHGSVKLSDAQLKDALIELNIPKHTQNRYFEHAVWAPEEHGYDS